MKTKLKALIIIRRNQEILAVKGVEKIKNKDYYRIIGGTIEFQETSRDAITREVREELGSDIENLKLHSVEENIFEFQGEQIHQIEFIYSGELANKDLYKQEHITITEPYASFNTDWVPIEKIKNEEIIMFPEIKY